MVAGKDLVFREEQRFPGWIRWLVFPLDAGFLIALILFLFGFFEKGQCQPIPLIITVSAVILVSVALTALFWFAKLETEVRADGLYIRYFPAHIRLKKFRFEDIAKYYVREYKPLREYGGYGIRWSSVGKAYNVSGKKGVQLILKNTRDSVFSTDRVLIGSQRPEELVAAIDSIVKPQPS